LAFQSVMALLTGNSCSYAIILRFVTVKKPDFYAPMAPWQVAAT